MSTSYLDSRRLTGANLYFPHAGAVLEIAIDSNDVAHASAKIEAWRALVVSMTCALQWPSPAVVARQHHGGAALAFSAPIDQLFCATEVNEWAWRAAAHALPESARVERDKSPQIGSADSAITQRVDEFLAPGFAAIRDFEEALQTLLRLSASESNPKLIAIVSAARDRRVPIVLDDDILSLGTGQHARSWPIETVPEIDAIDWTQLRSIPVGIVTGSNGKTTTTRIVAAMLAAQGLTPGFSSTDGIFVAGTRIDSGDYSGPAGARTVLRDARVRAAVLETARGGILRRGISIDQATAALVTNISADHFGEYGIDDVEGLADAKLVVARALGDDGVLILNADDALLVARAPRIATALAWFALAADHPILIAHRTLGGATCGVRAGRLVITDASRDATISADHDLGAIAAMPLSMQGAAIYNVSNMAGAALLARALGVDHATIAQVLARFGSNNDDNVGRLMRWSLQGVNVLLDYAHNSEGLKGLLAVAQSVRQGGRLAIMLGQAGNRSDAEIRELAELAAQIDPDFVVVKELESMLRGRALGEISRIMCAQLHDCGIADKKIAICADELEAARTILAWARRGDVLVLPAHDKPNRGDIVALLDGLDHHGWVPGSALPSEL